MWLWICLWHVFQFDTFILIVPCFEGTFGHTQLRNNCNQCNYACKQFENSFSDILRRKTKQIQALYHFISAHLHPPDLTHLHPQNGTSPPPKKTHFTPNESECVCGSGSCGRLGNMEKVNHSDYWRPKVNEKFDLVWNSNWGKAQHTVAMEQNLDEFGLKNANVKIWKNNAEKSTKCNQCDFASSHAGHLRQ